MCGHVVDAAARPGMAPRQAGRRQRRALDEPVLLHRTDRIRGAGGVVLADVAVEMGDRRAIAVQQGQSRVARDQREGTQGGGCREAARSECVRGQSGGGHAAAHGS